MRRFRGDSRGFALVVTLMAVALITAMVIEFAYAVYTGTNSLYNWRDSQRLSVMARSGINIAPRVITEFMYLQDRPYQPVIDFPVENPFEDFSGTITVRMEDETSKFNINALVFPNNTPNDDAYKAFRRLLRILSLDENIADRIIDWIDENSTPRPSDSERGSANSVFHSVDELLSLPGISRKDYNTLLPYITALGRDEDRDNLVININGAAKPVLQCLWDSEDMAESIIERRKTTFIKTAEQIAGQTNISLVTTGNNFLVRSGASSGGVKRIIEMVFNKNSGTVSYWKEY